MPKCPHCARSFDGSHALKIHIGRTHKSEAPAASDPGPGRRRGRPPGRRPGRPPAGAADLTTVSTAALLGELRRRAEMFDRIKSLTDGM